MMLTNNEVCEAIGIKPKYLIKYTLDSEYYDFNGNQEKVNAWIKDLTERVAKFRKLEIIEQTEIFPDFLSRTPEASFNRELLEECIFPYSQTGFSVIPEEDNSIAIVAGSGFKFKSGRGKTRPEALLNLVIQLKDEIKEEVSKVTEFIY